jgi:hypothetical protein
VPPALLDTLDMVHGIREAQSRRGKGRGERLWPWSRMTGWRAVHAVMVAAGLDGPQASPKGLRHGFGVAAVSAGHPTQPRAEMARPRPATTVYANARWPWLAVVANAHVKKSLSVRTHLCAECRHTESRDAASARVCLNWAMDQINTREPRCAA